MKITLLCVGKTDNKHLESLINDYVKRLSKSIGFSVEYIEPRNVKKLKARELKKAEGELILQKLIKSQRTILLDEHGKSFTSVKFAHQIQHFMNAGYRQITFVIGGAFGFSEEVYEKADEKLSLSSMTTTHQLIRLFFVEQLYRSFSIINNHPYHNE